MNGELGQRIQGIINIPSYMYLLILVLEGKL